MRSFGVLLGDYIALLGAWGSTVWQAGKSERLLGVFCVFNMRTRARWW